MSREEAERYSFQTINTVLHMNVFNALLAIGGNTGTSEHPEIAPELPSLAIKWFCDGIDRFGDDGICMSHDARTEVVGIIADSDKFVIRPTLLEGHWQTLQSFGKRKKKEKEDVPL